ncbi:phage tail protein [Sciscionella sediminilitoris]|uniref:phage tail protein n=1 Tax=Sciscionella sediminilitoris TaxID=1445613 RepID=UPI0004DF908E|nr:hypothetical protein [Sciscionella sp. SE31]
MPASGGVLGNVSIRVFPDTKNFLPSLEKYLKRIENRVRVELPVTADTTRLSEEVKAAAIRLSAEAINKRVTADTEPATREIAAWRARMAAIGAVTVRLGVDRQNLQALSRSLTTISGAIAGIGGKALVFGGLAAGVGAAVSAAGQLLVTLQQIAPAAALLPAGIAAAGAAAATLKVGVSGVGDALKNAFDPKKVKQFNEAMAKLAPNAQAFVRAIQGQAAAFRGLKLDVQQRLFAGLGAQINTLATAYLPVLRAGMTGVAGELNGLARNFVAMATSSQSLRDTATIFANTRDSVGGLSAVVINLGDAFRSIAAVGSGFLPQIANSAGAAAARFREFIDNARQTGQLQQWIQGALTALGQLFAIVRNLGSILASVFSAANASGTSLFATLANITGQIAAFLKSAQGTRMLGQIFGGLRAALDGVMPVLAAVGQAIATNIAPAIAQLGPMIGSAFRALVPAIAPLGQALGALAPVIGNIAVLFATTLTAAIQALLPIVQALAPVLAQLADTLGPVLSQAIGTMGPPLVQIVATLATGLAPIINALVPLITQFGQLFATYWQGVILPVLQAIMPVLQLVATIFANVFTTAMQALLPVLPVIGQALAQIAGVLGQAILAVLQAITPIMPQIAAAFAQFAATLATALVPVIQALAPLFPILASAVASILQAVLPVLPAIGQLAAAFAPLIATLAQILIPIIQSLLPIVTTVFQAIVPVIRSVLQVITGVVQVFTGLLSGNWSQVWNGIKNIVGGVLKTIASIITGALSVIGQTVWSGLKAVGNFFAGIFGGIVRLVGDAIGSVVGWFGRLPGMILGAIGDAGRWLVNVGRDIVNGLWEGIKAMGNWLWNQILNFIKSFVPGPILRFLGISSPSKYMRDNVGRWIPAGIADGIDQAAPKVSDAMNRVSQIVGNTNMSATATLTARTTGSDGFFAGLAEAVAAGAERGTSMARPEVYMDGRRVTSEVNRTNRRMATR